jgi:hypothetical protein
MSSPCYFKEIFYNEYLYGLPRAGKIPGRFTAGTAHGLQQAAAFSAVPLYLFSARAASPQTQ